MRTSVFALGAISLAASLAFATPASATSTVAVNGACSNMTDGVASSCHFSGNITTGTNGAGDYRLTENAYNNVYAPAHNYPANLNLTPLAEFDPGNANQTSGGITFSSRLAERHVHVGARCRPWILCREGRQSVRSLRVHRHGYWSIQLEHGGPQGRQRPAAGPFAHRLLRFRRRRGSRAGDLGDDAARHRHDRFRRASPAPEAVALARIVLSGRSGCKTGRRCFVEVLLNLAK